MTNEDKLVEELVKNALFRIDESTRMIQKSLTNISEEEFWQKPNASLNSIGNLILHLCGNITQYIISSLGETEDLRNRDHEFSAKETATKKETLKQLEQTVDIAKRVVFDTDISNLLKVRSVQGFTFSGVGVIVHAVEHYSYHTGQIAFWVKQLKNEDLGFYDGIEVKIKNKH
jgi:uncharacterized damage-inducible protein DinB